MKVLSTAVGPASSLPLATIDRSHNRLDVACGDGYLLTLLTVQPEGGSVMSGEAFLRGHSFIVAFE